MNGIEAAFIARVGTEPELKTSQTGKAWTAFSACVSDGDDAQWVKVVAFGNGDERGEEAEAKDQPNHYLVSDVGHGGNKRGE